MSSSADVSTSTVSSSSERFIGRVKWFNNKAGYGFVTITDGSRAGSDVFVHHSSIKVDSEQYKYLIQGEYVEFNLLETKNEKHEFQAGEVCGIKSGKLMCETRRDLRSARTQYKALKTTDEVVETTTPVKMPKSVPPPKQFKTSRVRGQGPRQDGEWTHVSRNKKQEPSTNMRMKKHTSE
jgi:CspA family cold shock protein